MNEITFALTATTPQKKPARSGGSVVWVRTEQVFQRLFGPLFYDIIKP
jgi:hypothetical protein